MINYARQEPEDQPEATAPPAEDHIAPAPRVSVQAFCETVETAAAVQSAGDDRRPRRGYPCRRFAKPWKPPRPCNRPAKTAASARPISRFRWAAWPPPSRPIA